MLRLFAAALLMVATGVRVHAQDAAISLTLKDHRFVPAEVTIPAGAKTRILVRNEDATPAEFESDDFTIEKVLPGGREIVVPIPALTPGTYEFHDEYHPDSSKSRLIAK